MRHRFTFIFDLQKGVVFLKGSNALGGKKEAVSGASAHQQPCRFHLKEALNAQCRTEQNPRMKSTSIHLFLCVKHLIIA